MITKLRSSPSFDTGIHSNIYESNSEAYFWSKPLKVQLPR